MRWWIKISIGILGALALCIAALIALRLLNDWRYEKAVAAAAAWNLNEWETGTALRATASYTSTSFEGTRERSKKFTCHRKKHVRGGQGVFRAPKTDVVYRALGYRHVFASSTGRQRVSGLPTQDLCRRLFLDDITPPQTLGGPVLINNDSSDDLTGYEVLLNTRRNTCALTWDAQDHFLLGDLEISPVVLSNLEEVPMQSAVIEFKLMGSAEAVDELMLTLLMYRKDHREARFTWDRAQLCWVQANGSDCENRADDLCGIPKF